MDNIKRFEDQPIRTAWDEEKEEWYFSIVDVVCVLTEQPDTRHAAKYWSVLKSRLKKEGSELTTICSQLKMRSSENPYGLDENRQVAQSGGRIAGDARKNIEAQTGKPVVTSDSAAELNEVVTGMIEGVVSNEEKVDE